MKMIAEQKRIALVAHDNEKAELLDWSRFNRETLSHHLLFATGTTGNMLTKELDLPITRFSSGPLGGDQQVGAAISSFGMPSNLNPTTQTSRLCCAWRFCTTSPPPATGLQQISSSHPH
jgi:hypothetical protein